VGSHGRARHEDRAAELGAKFGRRHPRLALIITCALLTGVIALCAFQLHYGAYLGRGWAIAAGAGMAAAASLSAAAVISTRRHPLALGRLTLAWLVLALLSVSAIGYPFPQGRYGSVQAFFNVLHSALLGYEAVTCAALIGLLAYVLARARGRRA
jgi:hypothetical protein